MSYSGAPGAQEPLAATLLPQGADAKDVNPDLALVMSLFSASTGTTFNPAAQVPIGQFTMTELQRGKRTQVASLTRFAWESGQAGNDWWWGFVKVLPYPEANQVITVIEARNSSMVPAPEGSAPPFVEFVADQRIQTMQRYHLGAKAWLDPLLDPARVQEGIQLVQLQLRTVVNGAWIAARSIIITAIVNSLYGWQNFYLEHGAPYGNIQEPLMAPNDLFGCLNTDEKAMAKLVAYGFNQMQDRRPTDVVFGPNTLPWLALKQQYHTEPLRVGDARAQAALTNGEQAMSLFFSGVGLTARQDRIPSVNNLSRRSLDLLSMETSVSSYMVASAEHEIRKPNGTLDVKSMLTIGYRDMGLNGTGHIGPETLIRKSMRFDQSMENYSVYMRQFAKDPLAPFRRNKVQPVGGMLDPFFYKVTKDSTSPGTGLTTSGAGYAAQGGYAPLDCWGDMDPRYRTIEHDIEHGRNARSCLADDTHLGRAGIEKVYTLLKQMDKLYNPPSLDAGVMGLAILVASLNAPTAGNLAAGASVPGAPEGLPQVNAAGNLTVSLLVAPAGGGVAVLTPLVLYGSFPNAGNTTFPVQYSLEDPTGALAAAPAGTTKRAISAPKLPYGMSTLPDVIRLNMMDRTTGAAYNLPQAEDAEVAALKKALEEGLPELRNLYEQQHVLYPYLMLDGDYVPFYMRTGDPATDAYYAWFENTLATRKSKMPLFARRMLNTLVLNVNSVNDARSGTSPVRIDGAKLAAFWDAAGLTGINIAAPRVDADVVVWDNIITQSGYVDPTVQEDLLSNTAAKTTALKNYFESSSLGSDYIVDWKSRHGGAAIASSQAFARFLEDEVLPEVAKATVDSRDKAARVFGGITGIIASSIRARVVKPSITLNREYITRLLAFQGRKRGIAASDSYTQQAEGAVAASQGVTDVPNEWINTRLSISRDHFVAMQTAAEMPGASDADVLRIANLPVRPANPENPHQPLYTSVVDPTAADRVALAKTKTGAFKYAAAFPYSRSYSDDFFYRHLPLYRHGLGGRAGSELKSTQRSRTDYLEQVQGSGVPASYAQSPFSVAGGQGAFLPQSTQPVDPSRNLLFKEQRYESATGSPLPDKTVFVQKTNLLFRVEQIYAQETDPLVRQCAILMNLSKSNGASEIRWIKHGLLPPVTTYVFYQHDIAFRTTPALFYRGGGDTARFGSRWDDASEQYNATHKSVLWHFTTWMSCTIIDEKNFLFVKHVKIEEYLRGMDGLIYDNPKDFDPTKPRGPKSGFVFDMGSSIGREYFIQYCNPMPLGGKHLQKFFPYKFSHRDQLFNPAGFLWPTAAFYIETWKLDEFMGNQVVNMTSYQAERQNYHVTGTAWMGTTFVNKHALMDDAIRVAGTGPLHDWSMPLKEQLSGKVGVSATYVRDQQLRII